MFDFIFETVQKVIPTTVNENIQRGLKAMRQVLDTKTDVHYAMFRKDLGWIAFSWGTEGKAPPEFKNRKEAALWWATLSGKTNGNKGSKVFKGGYGVSHIIAKRDWEAQWMKHFAKQSGKDAAMKCVEVIAKGKMNIQRQKRVIVLGKWYVTLIPDSHYAGVRGNEEEYWLLTGFEATEEEEYQNMESADVVYGANLPVYPTHTMHTGRRHSVGATESMSERIVFISLSQVNRWGLEEPEYGTAAYGFSLNF